MALRKCVFIGNPGVGKSTILNGHLQKNLFSSGVSLGKGKTTKTQVYETPGFQWTDTPGLSDVKLRDTAAKQIYSALEQGGKFSIFFVFKLDSGRIREEDKRTLNAVAAAAGLKKNEYSILLNKVTTTVLSKIENDWDSFTALSNEGTPGTNRFCVVPYDENLDDADDVIPSYNDVVSKWIEKPLNVKYLEKREVQQVSTDEFTRAERAAELKIQMKKMEEENRRRKEQLEEKESEQRLKNYCVNMPNYLAGISSYQCNVDGVWCYWDDWPKRDSIAKGQYTHDHGRISFPMSYAFSSGRWYCCIDNVTAKRIGVKLDY